MWPAHDYGTVRATVRDNKEHTPRPRIDIKIPDSAGNRTRAAGLLSRVSTDHTTATDHIGERELNLQGIFAESTVFLFMSINA